MREAQVEATGVNVEGVTEVAAGHCGALNVPTGAAAPKWRGPRSGFWFAGFGTLPQREVARIPLSRFTPVAGREHLIGVLVGECAVFGEGGHVEPHYAAAAGICVGMPAFEEALDDVDHVDYVTRRARFVVGRGDVQRIVSGGEFAFEAHRPGPPVGVVGGGFF